MALTEASLLREVAKLQRDKTLLAVMEIVDSISTTEMLRGSYSATQRTARDYRDDLRTRLKALREAD